MSDHNDNRLVFDRFVADIASLDVRPLFYLDRGYQYTSKPFRKKLVEAGMIKSVLHVVRCTDNGPMEGFLRDTDLNSEYKYYS